MVKSPVKLMMFSYLLAPFMLTQGVKQYNPFLRLSLSSLLPSVEACFIFSIKSTTPLFGRLCDLKNCLKVTRPIGYGFSMSAAKNGNMIESKSNSSGIL